MHKHTSHSLLLKDLCTERPTKTRVGAPLVTRVMNFTSVGRDFSSVQGPTDDFLRRSEIEGYQPVSRIGETVINSFVE